MRFLCKRFGGEAAAWRAALEQVGRADLLEALSESLYDATSREEAEAALERAKG